VAESVRRAAAEGLGVRVAGSGHSFSPLVPTDDVLLSLEHVRGLESVDVGRRRATVRAGTVLHELGGLLHEHGLALHNLGDVDVQALAGALATGTHGTGRELANLSSRVVALRLVTAEGEVREVDAAQPDLLRAARVSLGALGVVTAATLELVPAYRLHERRRRPPVDEVVEGFDAATRRHRHFEFFWFPFRDLVETKTLDPTEEEPEAVRERPYERIGWSFEVLPSVRELRFHEMEYALPAEEGAACFARLRRRMLERHADVAWPVEVRSLAPDDAFLSPAHARPTVTVSVHQDARLPHRELFADLEPLLREHGGRPHWGKVHSLGAAELAPLYPAWDAFRAERERLDPGGRFCNRALGRLLLD